MLPDWAAIRPALVKVPLLDDKFTLLAADTVAPEVFVIEPPAFKDNVPELVIVPELDMSFKAFSVKLRAQHGSAPTLVPERDVDDPNVGAPPCCAPMFAGT